MRNINDAILKTLKVIDAMGKSHIFYNKPSVDENDVFEYLNDSNSNISMDEIRAVFVQFENHRSMCNKITNSDETVKYALCVVYNKLHKE